MVDLYRVLEIKKNEFTFKETLSTKENKHIREASEKVNSIFKETDFYEQIELAYNDYLLWADESDPNKIVRIINSYLSAYREFIDGWEAFLKREKGEKTINFWQDAVRKVYDDHFEYRFIYNLRNYVQHVHGKPFTNLSRSLEGHIIFLDKKSFLENHKNMQPSFAKELKDNSFENINVHQAIVKTHEQLIELQKQIFNFILTFEHVDFALLKAAYDVLTFYNEHNNKEDTLSLTKSVSKKFFQNPNEDFTISRFEIPVGFARVIANAYRLNFELEGTIVGYSPTLPFEHNKEIYIGKERALYEEMIWIRLIQEETRNRLHEKPDKYYTKYMVDVFTMNEYEEIINRLKR